MVLKNGRGVSLKAKRPKNDSEAHLMGFLLYVRLKGAEALKRLAPQGFLMFLFDVFDFLCQFQAIYVFFMILMMNLVSIIIFIEAGYCTKCLNVHRVQDSVSTCEIWFIT
ncbi:hypothetical protein Hanom_Chr07g00656521 [Helianthus anomalus]